MALLASYATHTNPGESIFYKNGINVYDGAAQPFSHSQGITESVSTMQAELQKTGTPTEPVVFAIYTDVAGAPGVSLGSASIAGGSITAGSYNNYPLTPGGTILLLTGVQYWFVLNTVNAGSDTSNFYQWGIGNTSIPYPAENYKLNGVYNVETGYNCVFEIDGSAGTGATLPYRSMLGVGI